MRENQVFLLYRLRSMLYKVEPYLRKNTTLEAFEVLPTIAKVFHTLKTKLNDTVLEEFGKLLSAVCL